MVLAVQVHHVQGVLLRINEVELLQVRVQGDGVGRFQTLFEDRFTASAIRTNLLNSLRTRIGEKEEACEIEVNETVNFNNRNPTDFSEIIWTAYLL